MELNLEIVTTPLRQAATVVMLRDAPTGLEVFLMKRHALSDVLGGAYVFPGGKVDALDAELDMVAHLDQPLQALHAGLNEADISERTAGGLYVAALREAFEGALHGQLSQARLQTLSVDMVQAVCGMPTPVFQMDRRIEAVLRRLRQASGKVPLPELAATACLSPDRLTHLFREQTGLSIKRYLVWAKIRRSVQQMNQGRPLTDIAHDCGFSDSAHMSHTYQQHFGLPPSFLADAGRVAVTVDQQAFRAWGE